MEDNDLIGIKGIGIYNTIAKDDGKKAEIIIRRPVITEKSLSSRADKSFTISNILESKLIIIRGLGEVTNMSRQRGISQENRIMTAINNDVIIFGIDFRKKAGTEHKDFCQHLPAGSMITIPKGIAIGFLTIQSGESIISIISDNFSHEDRNNHYSWKLCSKLLELIRDTTEADKSFQLQENCDSNTTDVMSVL